MSRALGIAEVFHSQEEPPNCDSSLFLNWYKILEYTIDDTGRGARPKCVRLFLFLECKGKGL